MPLSASGTNFKTDVHKTYKDACGTQVFCRSNHCFKTCIEISLAALHEPEVLGWSGFTEILGAVYDKWLNNSTL
ncbi:hypothetical protein NEILACOT_04768 [Neisseria lactamica ATCC 23970]|uniref:Uncharacterized protein n=1 Tax=Neisseria lactamica ATCC 23970 TaxID=546265 RepID=D0WB44_NEILA|nr:hypothetical protein NEILACOT_04768 [Neisseria lactamica ATCC 23970]